jgi:hypothetical protein
MNISRTPTKQTVRRNIVKHQTMSLCRCLLVLLFVVGSWSGASAAQKKKQQHPPLTEQEQLIACDQCHQETTPELHKEWFDSNHGLAMVKCYQCHGTFETFRITPKPQDCAACHENMMHKCPQNKACWQCHIPHSFKRQK